MKAWHFLRSDRCLAYPPHTQVEVGQTLALPNGEAPVLCKRGYHASARLIDALSYAPVAHDLVLCRVTLGGTTVSDTDKAVASTRTCHAMIEADALLREWACWCAEAALLGQALSPRGVPSMSGAGRR